MEFPSSSCPQEILNEKRTYQTPAEHPRGLIQQRWNVSGEKTKRGEGRFPAETWAGAVTNINIPHRSRSTGQELKPTRVLHSGAVAFCDFTILERVHAGATTAAAAGVRYIPTAVQSRRGGAVRQHQCFTERKLERKCFTCTDSDLCVSKPANQTEALYYYFY